MKAWQHKSATALASSSPPQRHTLCCLHAGSWKVS